MGFWTLNLFALGLVLVGFFDKRLGGAKNMSEKEKWAQEILDARVTYGTILSGPYKDFLEIEKIISSQFPRVRLVYAKTSLAKLRICTDPGEAANDGNSRE